MADSSTDVCSVLRSLLVYYHFEGADADRPTLRSDLDELAQSWGESRLQDAIRRLSIWICAGANGLEHNLLTDLTWSEDVAALIQAVPELDTVFDLAAPNIYYRSEVSAAERAAIERLVMECYRPTIHVTFRKGWMRSRE